MIVIAYWSEGLIKIAGEIKDLSVDLEDKRGGRRLQEGLLIQRQRGVLICYFREPSRCKGMSQVK